MPVPPIYVDTSAMVKRYVHEPTSPDFDRFVAASDAAFYVSPLTLTEFESVLRRRLRQRDFNATYLRRVKTLFSSDLHAAVWQLQPFPTAAFSEASRLIADLGVPLATLDALHLASAHAMQCAALATSDGQLARAAARSGLVVHNFQKAPSDA